MLLFISIAFNVLLFAVLFVERPRIELRRGPFRVLSVECYAVRALPHTRSVYELEQQPSRN